MRVRWVGHVARTGYLEVHTFLSETLKGNNIFGRHGRRWEDNIRMDLRETG
jgi:hypothetical protein